MDLRRPYRPCQPASAGPSWFLPAAVVLTVAVELLLGVWLVLAVVR